MYSPGRKENPTYYKIGRLTGFFISCVGTAFKKHVIEGNIKEGYL